MAKTLYQRKKDLRRNPAKYMRLVARPRFVCAGCGRAARKKKHLYEPTPLDGSVIKPRSR